MQKIVDTYKLFNLGDHSHIVAGIVVKSDRSILNTSKELVPERSGNIVIFATFDSVLKMETFWKLEFCPLSEKLWKLEYCPLSETFWKLEYHPLIFSNFLVFEKNSGFH